MLLRRHTPLPALNCIQYNAEKKICTEDDIIQSNIKGFGSKIGQVTNRITAMTSMMSNYAPDSEEYKILYYRVQCGQAQQQAEIDKAKGIISNPMPKGWYDQKANKIKDDDSPEEKARKKLYQKLCANRKPYFFIYNYASEMEKYKKYVEKYELEAPMYWGISLQELLFLENKTEEQHEFIDAYFRSNPMDMSRSTMNKICFKIETYMDEFKLKDRQPFDYSILKSGRQYNSNIKHKIEQIYKKYKNSIKTIVLEFNDDFSGEELSDYKDSVIDWFGEQCHIICPDDVMLCDILIDICYSGRNQKEIVWQLCGDIIVDNLLRHTNGDVLYPKKVEQDGDFECMGSQFTMVVANMGGEQDD